jgi:hypothetical protein
LILGLGTSTHSAKAFSYASMTRLQKRLLSGHAHLELSSPLAASARNASSAPARAVEKGTAAPALGNYFPGRGGDCPLNLGGDVKINQNCASLTDADLQGRSQANNETSIAQDPNHPERLVASDNDYRRGDGACGVAYSTDHGATWSDATAPFGFTRGQPTFGTTREYWQAGGDTSVAWDTKGNAYLSCQVFNRGAPLSPNPDRSSAFYVFRSTQNGGASWTFPGRPVTEANDTEGAGTTLEDKQLLTVDNHAGSPFQDRVYVTWTEFAADGSGYIWESYSSDYGEHFSPRALVSTDSPLCVQTFGAGTPQGNCNANQFSQPFTAPDGTLYVVFNNYNNAGGHPVGDPDQGGDDDSGTDDESDIVSAAAAPPTPDPNDNHNQVLLVKSTDGGQTFSAPVKVADFYDLPDCFAYQGQDAGRACVPEKGTTSNSFFRATNYPVGAVNPKQPNQVVVTFGSYIHRGSKESNGCAPAGLDPDTTLNLYTGVKTPGACNNDILISVSKDAGQSFTGGKRGPRRLRSLNQDRAQAATDQWFQWAAFTDDGQLAVSYYDRQYGDDEITGFSDFSLSVSRDVHHFETVRVTSASMPPPTQFSGTFWGDYTGLSAIGGEAHPTWSDTRPVEPFLCSSTGAPGAPPTICTAPAANAAVANDQEIFTKVVRIP